VGANAGWPRGLEGRVHRTTRDDERDDDDAGRRHPLHPIKPTAVRRRRRGSRLTLFIGVGSCFGLDGNIFGNGTLRGAPDRQRELREPVAILDDGVGDEDELRRNVSLARGQEHQLRARRHPADLRDDRRMVVEGKLLVDDDDVGLPALNLQEQVRHGARLREDGDPVVLEQEAKEAALEGAAIRHDRRPPIGSDHRALLVEGGIFQAPVYPIDPPVTVSQRDDLVGPLSAGRRRVR
jgi:hypothetical protein